MKYTKNEAALIFDLNEAQAAGTPQESQIADGIRGNFTPDLWERIERDGGLEAVAETLAQDPDFVDLI